MKHLNKRSDKLNLIKDKVENSLELNGTKLPDKKAISGETNSKIK